jgi:hypothetical protein
MPFARALAAVAVSPAGLVYVCGGVQGDSYPFTATSALHVYNISSNTWAPLYDTFMKSLTFKASIFERYFRFLGTFHGAYWRWKIDCIWRIL